MAQLDLNTLWTLMVQAATKSLAGSIPSLTNVASSSFKTLAQNLIDIEEMRVAGTVTQEQAKLLIDMQKNAVQTVLLTEEGLGLIAVQNAINAAIDVVRQVVNTALGWQIL